VKTIARIGTAIVVAITSLFVAAPAFAHEGGEKIDPTAAYSSAGGPLQVGAILICGLVLLAIVLVLAQLLSAPFQKNAHKR